MGALSVRSAPTVTCPAEGWLTLGAGGYAAVPRARHGRSRRRLPGRPVPARCSCAASARRWPAPPAASSTPGCGSTPTGLAGRATPAAWPRVGPGAALAAADGDGAVARYAPDPPATGRPFAGPCRATLSTPARSGGVDAGARDGAGRDRGAGGSRLVGRGEAGPRTRCSGPGRGRGPRRRGPPARGGRHRARVRAGMAVVVEHPPAALRPAGRPGPHGGRRPGQAGRRRRGRPAADRRRSPAGRATPAADRAGLADADARAVGHRRGRGAVHRRAGGRRRRSAARWRGCWPGRRRSPGAAGGRPGACPPAGAPPRLGVAAAPGRATFLAGTAALVARRGPGGGRWRRRWSRGDGGDRWRGQPPPPGWPPARRRRGGPGAGPCARGGG